MKMKDLLQEGRNIQETFKKNTMNESVLLEGIFDKIKDSIANSIEKIRLDKQTILILFRKSWDLKIPEYLQSARANGWNKQQMDEFSKVLNNLTTNVETQIRAGRFHDMGEVLDFVRSELAPKVKEINKMK